MENSFDKVKDKLAGLRLQEKQLQIELQQKGEQILENLKPGSLLKSAASGVFKDKTIRAEAATAALGLGAGLVAKALVRSPHTKPGLIAKVAGVASGFLIKRFLTKRKGK
jgi:hypothetical protein